MRDTQREAETEAEGEAGPMQEARVGLDPRTLGSCPGPKAGAKPLSHPGIPKDLLNSMPLCVSSHMNIFRN